MSAHSILGGPDLIVDPGISPPALCLSTITNKLRNSKKRKCVFAWSSNGFFVLFLRMTKDFSSHAFPKLISQPFQTRGVVTKAMNLQSGHWSPLPITWQDVEHLPGKQNLCLCCSKRFMASFATHEFEEVLIGKMRVPNLRPWWGRSCGVYCSKVVVHPKTIVIAAKYRNTQMCSVRLLKALGILQITGATSDASFGALSNCTGQLVDCPKVVCPSQVSRATLLALSGATAMKDSWCCICCLAPW